MVSTAARNRIQGVDPNASIATQAWLRRSAAPSAKLSADERESLRLQHVGTPGGDRVPEGLNIDLLPQSRLDEFRSQSALDGSAGAFGVAHGFVGALEMALNSLPMRRLATVDRIARGGESSYPTIDDRTNGTGALLGESEQESEVSVVFSSANLRPYKVTSGKVLVPHELTEDAPRFAAQMGAILGRRIARIQNSLATNGTGTGQPQGVVTGSTKVSAASATAIAPGDLFDLLANVAAGVFDSAAPVFMMTQTTWSVIQKLVDGNGQSLLDTSRRRLLGYPVIRNSNMSSTLASGEVSVLFGDFRAVRFIEVADVRLDAFTETAAELDQIIFRALLRFDSQLIDAGDSPIVGLEH